MIRNIVVGTILILFSLVSFSQENEKVKIKRQSPEPGTKLSYMSKAIVKRATNEMSGNPDSAFMAYDNKTTFRKKPAYKLIDTVITEHKVPLRIFYPKKAKKTDALPVIIFYHGGAFMYGNIETYNNLAGKICRESKCIVVLPEYRLAPEYPFPAAVNDCYATYEWTKENIGNMGGDKAKISLIGDSAGANLSLVTALKAYENGFNDIASLSLIYPNTIWTDTLLLSREYFMGSKGPIYILSEELAYESRENYLNGVSPQHPYASPYYAKYYSDMPPTYVITAGCDPLRDEGELLVAKMQNSGMEVKHKRYKKMIHGFVTFYKVMPKGKKAIRESVRFANEYL